MGVGTDPLAASPPPAPPSWVGFAGLQSLHQLQCLGEDSPEEGALSFFCPLDP